MADRSALLGAANPVSLAPGRMAIRPARPKTLATTDLAVLRLSSAMAGTTADAAASAGDRGDVVAVAADKSRRSKVAAALEDGKSNAGSGFEGTSKLETEGRGPMDDTEALEPCPWHESAQVEP
eukprot:CAMPEP_0183461842 /NCGR_PEP_ID=MMETSP0370-20130417/140464_1 /TAXON_ID=268820 /ORGANISM="Peridinium aciculiferum, Strain PAER-2" /LENGTH=123 /DNA_ID=CAMNT_0025653831 /DNA_START=834 /DNA_END=1202 /DNA_ORIENTATION=+